MATSRTTLRAMRAIRTRPTPPSLTFRTRPAFRRTYADSVPTTSPHTNAGLIGGVVGGSAVFLLAYSWYYFSGVKTAVNSLHATKKYWDSSVKKVSDSVPEPNEALKWLRETALSYSAVIPGAKGYVNTAFDDLDAIHEKHADEVDQIVKGMYDEVKAATKQGGVSIETAGKIWEILGRRMKEISALAGDAAEQIMENHPQLKAQLGGNFETLKSLGDQLGPQAKEQVDKTWEQIQSILAKGLSVSSIPEIKKLVQEKAELLRGLADEGWKKGLEQAKPYLDKNPTVKKLVEENADALKQGNVAELWKQVKAAVDNGSTDDLQKYVSQAADKAKQGGKAMGFDVDKVLGMVPGGGEIAQKWEQLSSIGEKHGEEAKQLFESTVKEIKDVLSKKVQDAQKLADKAGKDAKDSVKK